jgi:hypothetical protein
MLNVNRGGVNGWGQPFCDTIFTATLGAGAETTLTVPAKAGLGVPSSNQFNKFLAVFSVQDGAKVWVAVNATAAVPAGAAFAASTSEMINPAASCKYCKTGDILHFVSAAAADISVAFYAIQE